MQINPAALRALRERSGMSVSDLAEAVGCRQAHLSNVELGRRGASPALVKKLAEVLAVPIPAIVTNPQGDVA